MTWFREMLSLFRQHRQVDRDYKAAMRALDARIEEIRRRG